MIKRILVIDDDEAVRKVFLLALEESEFQADTAPSGEKGLEMMKEEKYDLIYLDLKMPGMNGMETLKKLRAMDKEIPVYIITAFYGEFLEELKMAKQEGLDFELMKKPLTIKQIASLTSGILEGLTEYE